MSPTLTKTAPDELATLWRAHTDHGDQAARNRLLEHYLPLVRYIAERLYSRLPSHVNVDDLVSFGTSGLIDAVESFDPGRKVRFKTYCSPRIRGAMLDGLRSMDWVPRLVRSRARKLQHAHGALKASLGRMPTEKETAAQLDMSIKEFRMLQKDAFPVEVSSLSDILSEDRSGKAVCIEHFLASDHACDPQRAAMQNDLKDFLTRSLAKTERLVLMLYYYEGMNMKEIGRTMDLSESRVCQIHSAALASLRQRFQGMKLSSILHLQGDEPG